MIIYKDIFTDAEMLTDTYKAEEQYNKQVLRVEGKLVTEKDDIDESKLGANKSAEEAQEEADTESKQGCNVVLANRLNETFFGKKKDFGAYIKDHIPKIVKHMEEKERSDEDIKAFKDGVSQFMKEKVMANYKDFQFFLGEDNNVEATPCFCIYEGENPVMYYIKEALFPEKC